MPSPGQNLKPRKLDGFIIVVMLWVLSFAMLLGRLEVMTVLILLMSGFWNS